MRNWQTKTLVALFSVALGLLSALGAFAQEKLVVAV